MQIAEKLTTHTEPYVGPGYYSFNSGLCNTDAESLLQDIMTGYWDWDLNIMAVIDVLEPNKLGYLVSVTHI